MRKPSRINEAITALETTLNEETLRAIDDIAHYGATHGSRYTQTAMETYGFE